MRLHGRALVVAVGSILVATFACPQPALASVFAYYKITPASVNSPDGFIRSIRSSITNFNTGSDVSAGNFGSIYVNRVVFEIYNGNYGGLIQTGMGITTSDAPLDACGTKVNVHDYVEYRPMLSLSDLTGYSCFWGSAAGLGTEKLYAVGKVLDRAGCDGCYEAHVNGNLESPGMVALATQYGPATKPDYGEVSAEVTVDDTGQHGRFQFGYTQSGTYNFTWSNVRLDNSPSWNVVANADIAQCVNQDHHYAMSDPFFQGVSISRRYNDQTC
jgi:hypothetical protein